VIRIQGIKQKYVTRILHVQLAESFGLFGNDASQISIVIRVAWSFGSVAIECICFASLCSAGPTFRGTEGFSGIKAHREESYLCNG